MGKDQFPKEGEFLPFVKGAKEGFSPQCPYNYGLISKYLEYTKNRVLSQPKKIITHVNILSNMPPFPVSIQLTPSFA
jgi:hypothetical protein